MSACKSLMYRPRIAAETRISLGCTKATRITSPRILTELDLMNVGYDVQNTALMCQSIQQLKDTNSKLEELYLQLEGLESGYQQDNALGLGNGNARSCYLLQDRV